MAGVKGPARKRLLAGSHRHSSIPLRAKSEPTGPLPGDQWATKLFKYTVTVRLEGVGVGRGGGGGHSSRTPDFLSFSLSPKNGLLFNSPPSDIHRYRIFEDTTLT